MKLKDIYVFTVKDMYQKLKKKVYYLLKYYWIIAHICGLSSFNVQ